MRSFLDRIRWPRLLPVPPEYHERVRHRVLARARAGYLVHLVNVFFIVAVCWFALDDPPRTLIVGFAIQAFVAAAFLWIARGPWAKRHAIALAALPGIVIVFLIRVGLGPLFESDPIFLAFVVFLMMVYALFFAWGPGPQLLVGAALALLAFNAFPAGRPQAASAVGIVLLVGSVGFSTLGAYLIDAQRRQRFLHAQHLAAQARDRENLLQTGRHLCRTLSVAELPDRIAQQSLALMPCDAVSVQLADAEGKRVRIASIATSLPELAEFVGSEFNIVPDVAQQHLSSEAIVLPTELITNQVAHLTTRPDGPAVLSAVLAQGKDVLGTVSFIRLRDQTPFCEREQQTARDLAHQASIALINARLVHELRAANAAKAEFVSTMSHELRTPLHVILGYVEMLEDEQLNAAAPALGRIRDSAEELLELIQATLDVNRLEAGRDEPRPQHFLIDQLLREMAQEFDAIERAPRLALHWPERASGVALHTDRGKLKIILKNLISNALKFTADGSVAVAVDANADTCTLSVLDTGPGIPESDLDLVFEMFHQGQGSHVRARSGVGLGLYIVRRLCDQLGAELDLASEVGRGSVFRIRLPLVDMHANPHSNGNASSEDVPRAVSA